MVFDTRAHSFGVMCCTVARWASGAVNILANGWSAIVMTSTTTTTTMTTTMTTQWLLPLVSQSLITTSIVTIIRTWAWRRGANSPTGRWNPSHTLPSDTKLKIKNAFFSFYKRLRAAIQSHPIHNKPNKSNGRWKKHSLRGGQEVHQSKVATSILQFQKRKLTVRGEYI